MTKISLVSYDYIPARSTAVVQFQCYCVLSHASNYIYTRTWTCTRACIHPTRSRSHHHYHMGAPMTGCPRSRRDQSRSGAESVLLRPQVFHALLLLAEKKDVLEKSSIRGRKPFCVQVAPSDAYRSMYWAVLYTWLLDSCPACTWTSAIPLTSWDQQLECPVA